jgi:hypothetical protein
MGLAQGPKIKKVGVLILSPPKTGLERVSCPFFISQSKLRLTCVNLRVGWPFLSYEPKRQLTLYNLTVICSLLSIEPKLALTWL